MKHLRILGVFALALAFSGIAIAETQTVKVSGSVDAKWIYKENFDLRDNNDTSVVPLTGTIPGQGGGAAGAPNDETVSNDGADWFMSTVQVEIAADLTDNVSTVINLFNQRDWNANTYDAGVGATASSNVANEFDLGVDLAYVTLKEAFYAPLTLTLGRQDIEFGRGLIFGNWQIQDPQSTIIADEFSAVTSFDAARATLDFEPWTIDFVWANIAGGQGDANDEDDRNFWFTNVNYKFSEYNAVWEAYLGVDADNATADNTVPASATVTARSNETYVIGTRAQFDPVSNMTLGAEGAYQWGKSATTVVATESVDREAWMFNVFGEYRWADHAYKPYVGLEYFFSSGDERTSTGAATGSNEGWNGLFRSPTYGVIHDYLETYYQTALVSGTTAAGDSSSATNLQTFFISGGFAPMEDLKIDGKYYWFFTDEDVFSGTGGANQNVGTDLGTELDVNVTYDYTEDVTFTLGLAWFFPGDVYEGANTSATPGANNFGELDATASQVVTGVNVTF
jgi:hypothetical protein